jgi:hypothetical protein
MRSKIVFWLFHGSFAYTKLIPAHGHRDWRIWAKYASPSRHRFPSGALFLKANVITVRKGGLVFRFGKRNFVNKLVNSQFVATKGGARTGSVSRILHIPRDKDMTTCGFKAGPRNTALRIPNVLFLRGGDYTGCG